MACYACEDCGLSTQFGGKCDLFEYDCPFEHLRTGFGRTQDMVDTNLSIYSAALEQLKAANALLDNLQEDSADDHDIRLGYIIEVLEDMTSPETLAEWERINS